MSSNNLELAKKLAARSVKFTLRLGPLNWFFLGAIGCAVWASYI